MKKFLFPALMLAGALSMTSCLGSSTDDQKYTYNYGGSDCFNRIIDLDEGSEFIASAPSYTFEYNSTAGDVDITLSNLILSQGASPLSFKFPTMKYNMDASDGFIVTSGYAISPTNTSASAYLFNPFNMRAYYRNLGPVYYLRYTLEINNRPRYEVTTYANRYAYLGPVRATNLNDQTVYDTTSRPSAQAESSYIVLINQEKRTATFQIYNGKFADNMSPTTFMVKDLPLTFTSTGYTVSAGGDAPLDVYTATSGDKPAEDMSMTNLSIVGNLKDGASINFTCDLGDYGKYNVSAPLRYLIYSTSSDNN